MTFNDIPAGALVFIDANCPVYAATSGPKYGTPCQQLLELLTNDALIVAVMQDHDLISLASNDADFDRVAGMTRFAPV